MSRHNTFSCNRHSKVVETTVTVSELMRTYVHTVHIVLNSPFNAAVLRYLPYSLLWLSRDTINQFNQLKFGGTCILYTAGVLARVEAT